MAALDKMFARLYGQAEDSLRNNGRGLEGNYVSDGGTVAERKWEYWEEEERWSEEESWESFLDDD